MEQFLLRLAIQHTAPDDYIAAANGKPNHPRPNSYRELAQRLISMRGNIGKISNISGSDISELENRIMQETKKLIDELVEIAKEAERNVR